MFRDRDVALARSSPLGYASLLPTPTGKFEIAPHLVLLNEALVECFIGEKRRLIVTMPPGHSKSTTISRAGLGWHIGTFPERLVGLCSYEGTYAKTWGRTVRDDLIERGEQLFDVRVSRESNAADRWDLVGHTGGMRTAGIEGRLTGMRFYGIVIDDPIKDAKQAHSKVYRDACMDWLRSVIEGRLEPDAWIVIVLTRWHEDDLAGRVLKEQPGEWDVLNLPAIAEGNDLLGRKPGEALWPVRYNEKALAKKKSRVGTYWWNAQFQGRPSPESGNRIHRDWFRFFSTPPKGLSRIVTSTDCAFKDTEDSSFVVMQAWGQRGAEAYLLKQLRARMDFPETLSAFEQFHKSVARQFGAAGAKLVEDKANGPAVISMLKKKIPGIIPVEVTGKGSKIARLSAVSPYFEAKNIFVPEVGGCPWPVEDYIEELVAFPNGMNDDQVDATSQALEYLFGPTTISLSGGPEDDEKPKRGGSGSRASRTPAEPLSNARIERINLWGG